MEFLLSIKKVLMSIISWMESYPVISASLFTVLGTILSAVFDLRKRALNIISKTKSHIKQNIKISERSWIFNFFNNWHLFNIGGRKGINKSSEDFRQDIMLETPSSPLSPNQITICEQIANITEVHNLKKFDPKSLYEEAIKEKNSNGVGSAAIKYCQLFNKVVGVLENIAIEKNAKKQIENSIAVVKRLTEMLDKPTNQKALRKQFDDCERAIISVLAIIYEPA